MKTLNTQSFQIVRALAAAVVLLISGMVYADVLLIDEVRASKSMGLPDNGLSMEAVESRWGPPQSRQAAVGEPPITRWEYSDYSVYFEHDVVITSVLHSGAVIN